MRRTLSCLALFLTLALLTACMGGKSPPPPAREVLTAMKTAMTESAQTLPDGLTYTRAADPSAPDYLTDTLFSALYGEAARGLFVPEDMVDGESSPPISDAAIFLSVAPYPCELAVFRCSDLRAAATVAGLCRTRLDTVARGYRETEWAAVAPNGRVTVEGCYVFLVIAEDPASVLNGARGVLP